MLHVVMCKFILLRFQISRWRRFTRFSDRPDEAVKMLDKGIELAQTEGEIAHLVALKLSHEVQSVALQRLSN